MDEKERAEAELRELRTARRHAANEAAETLQHMLEGLGDMAVDLPELHERMWMFDGGAAIDLLRAQGELSMLRARMFELLNAATRATQDDTRD